ANAASTASVSVTSATYGATPLGRSPPRKIVATRSPSATKRSAMARPMPRAAPVTTTTRPVGPAAMAWVAGVVVTCSSLMVVAARRPRDSWGAAARPAVRVRCDATPAAEPAPRAAGHRDAAVLVGFLQSPRRPGFPGGPTTDVDWLDD